MSRSFTASLLAVSAALLCGTAQAQVTVKDPWVRATVAQQKATGAFMQLQSVQEARLVGARSPVAGVVEVHEMTLVGDVMKMRAIPSLPLPAGKAVELKPGGYHVMLMDLKAAVKDGETVPVTLIVEGRDGQRQNIEIQAPVRGMKAAPALQQGHGAHKH